MEKKEIESKISELDVRERAVSKELDNINKEKEKLLSDKRKVQTVVEKILDYLKDEIILEIVSKLQEIKECVNLKNIIIESTEGEEIDADDLNDLINDFVDKKLWHKAFINANNLNEELLSVLDKVEKDISFFATHMNELANRCELPPPAKTDK